MVPEGWEATEIGSIADFMSGGTPSKSNSKFWGGDYPWITGKDLKQHYLSSSIEMLTSEGFSVAKKAPAGSSLILVRGMTLLKDFPVGFAERTLSFNQDVKALIPKKNINGPFLSFLLAGKKDSIQKLVSTAGHGTGRLDTESIKVFPVNLPPLVEQEKIALILSTWDKAITATEQLLMSSQSQKKALMRQLLTGRVRFGEFSKVWQQYSLGVIFKERVEANYIDLPLLSITSDQGVIERSDVGRKDTSNADKAKYRRICPNDIGYNTMRMWQGVSGLSDREGIVSPAYTILIPQKQVDPLYASYLFKLPELIHVFYRHSQGLVSDTWNLKYSHFSKIKWHLPAIEEQRVIAKILAISDREIQSVKADIEYLKQEKIALMQQLLTGRRRVTVGEGD